MPRLLSHLSGARCLASLWIACRHLLPPGEWDTFSRFLLRSGVAVEFFIVLSGFVTHWAYASRTNIATRGGASQMYVRRIGRVAFTAWLTLIYMYLVSWYAGVAITSPATHNLACFCLIQPWFLPIASESGAIHIFCPNGVVWTVAALLPSWLMYPFVHHRALGAVGAPGGHAHDAASRGALLVLLLSVWAGLMVPMLLVYFLGGFYISSDAAMLFYMWPPVTLPAFAIGAIAAEAAHRHVRAAAPPPGPTAAPPTEAVPAANDERQPLYGSMAAAASLGAPSTRRVRWLRGVVTDASIALPLLAVLCVPSYNEDARGNMPPGKANTRDGYEPLLTHAFAPCFALFLYATATLDEKGGERSGLAQRFLTHRALTSLGDFSFVVYLFQAPVFRSFELYYGERFVALQTVEPKLAVAALVALYTLAGIYATLVEERVVAWLRVASAAWAVQDVVLDSPGAAPGAAAHIDVRTPARSAPSASGYGTAEGLSMTSCEPTWTRA